MFTQQKNIIDALRASLTKPEKNKTAKCSFAVWRAKSAKIGQSQNYAVIVSDLWLKKQNKKISWHLIGLFSLVSDH